jgi:hypothetical protein
VKRVKRTFTSNWEIYRVCLPSIIEGPNAYHSFTNLEGPCPKSERNSFMQKKGSVLEELSLRSTQIEIDAEAYLSKEPEASNRSFDKLLLEAVDEVLSSLGDSSKQAIYFHLENAFKIRKQDIPCKIDEFTNAIEKIFGLGAKMLEIQMMKALYEKVGYAFKYLPKQKDLIFTDYVKAALIHPKQKVKLSKKRKTSYKLSLKGQA